MQTGLPLCWFHFFSVGFCSPSPASLCNGKDSTSGATDSVIIRTDGRLVVLHKSLSQPMSAV